MPYLNVVFCFGRLILRCYNSHDLSFILLIFFYVCASFWPFRTPMYDYLHCRIEEVALCPVLTVWKDTGCGGLENSKTEGASMGGV